MDGVIYHGTQLLPGAKAFVEFVRKEKKQFLFLTNSSDKTPLQLQQKLHSMGIEVGAHHFYTSALATASFLQKQCPGGSIYVIGDVGLTTALRDAGFSMNDRKVDYVVVGETKDYNYDKMEKAVNLVLEGAKLVGANPDIADRIGKGLAPGTAALVAPIEKATGTRAYFVGKPNPIMMREAMKRLHAQPKDTMILGDRMDTDIIAGIESEIDTVLLLSGITQEQDIATFSYRPRYVFPSLVEFMQAYASHSLAPITRRFTALPQEKALLRIG